MNKRGEKRTNQFLYIIIVAALTGIGMLTGCGGGGDADSNIISAKDGDWAAGCDNQTGGFFEVVDNKLYNLTLSMDNPPSYGSCPTIVSGAVIKPGESEPFMEYANTNDAYTYQKIIYYGPIDINNDGSILIEESLTAFSCTQTFTISGQFANKNSISGTWEYTIDGVSATGSWFGHYLSTEDVTANTYLLPDTTIAIDGDRSDWQGILPMITDPEGDEDPDADFDGTDIDSIYLAKDNDFLYLMITLHDADPPVDQNSLYSIGFLKYSEAGVPGDRFAEAFLNYPPGGNMLVSIVEVATSASGWNNIAQYESGYMAAGEKFFEFKVPLNDIGDLDGRYPAVTVGMQETDENDLPIYPFSDQTDEKVRIQVSNVDN